MTAQGWILFQNAGGGVAAPISLVDDTSTADVNEATTGPKEANNIWVTLWIGRTADSLAPAMGTNADNPNPVEIKTKIKSKNFAGKSWAVQGIGAGTECFAQIKGKGDKYFGDSAVFKVTLTEPPATPAAMTALTGWTMQVPEPSILALGVLGMGAFLIRRRS